jgi:hypothetical protein
LRATISGAFCSACGQRVVPAYPDGDVRVGGQDLSENSTPRASILPLAVAGLNWYWISLAITVPPILGGLLAYIFWRKGQPTFGSIVGTAVIFGVAIALILREYVEIDRLTQRCLDEGQVCWPDPSAFTRFAIYAFIALLQVFALFSVSLRVDERIRRRDYAPEWR